MYTEKQIDQWKQENADDIFYCKTYCCHMLKKWCRKRQDFANVAKRSNNHATWFLKDDPGCTNCVQGYRVKMGIDDYQNMPSDFVRDDSRNDLLFKRQIG